MRERAQSLLQRSEATFRGIRHGTDTRSTLPPIEWVLFENRLIGGWMDSTLGGSGESRTINLGRIPQTVSMYVETGIHSSGRGPVLISYVGVSFR